MKRGKPLFASLFFRNIVQIFIVHSMKGAQMKHLPILLLVAFFLVSCIPAGKSPDAPVTSPPVANGPTDEPNLPDFLPQPGDANLIRATLYIHSAELLIRESFPPQISLGIKGDLPTPCHQLRVEINDPDSGNKISVDAYSVVTSDNTCVEVLKPFEEYINLGSYKTGHYTVWVNGEKVGEFDT